MIYLITCAGSKKTPENHNPSTLQKLSFNNSLYDARVNLINATQIELNWNLTLPAWQLYSGNRSKIYPQVALENWKKDCVDIRILSALFGWIKHTDLVPSYDLKMDDKIEMMNNMTIHNYWNNQNLLNNLIDEDNIDLLSGSYRKAIHGVTNPVATPPENVHFTDYGVQKGVWLNQELNKIECYE